MKIYRLDGVSGKINGLIFSKLSRLARSTKELLEFADIFKSSQASLISISENIDTSTPAGMLFYHGHLSDGRMGA